MKILFVTDAYPRNSQPNEGVFVYKFVQELAREGHKVTVIAFQRFHESLFASKTKNYGEELANVYRYPLITASAIQIGPFNTYSITLWQKVQHVRNTVDRYKIDYDVVYCHFIESAIFATKALPNLKKPLFVAVGENKNLAYYFKRHKEEVVFSALKKVSGFIAVSDIIKSKLIERFGVESGLIRVEPNGTDLSHYKPLDKNEMRKKFGFPLDAFIVIFVGRHLENKGPLRVLEATKNIEEAKMIFAGAGPQKPEHPSIIYNDKTPRDQIPFLLNCADVFVLPTQHEGSNNAIVEAMACGVPIVSSDIPEIHAQCNADFAILVDPMDVEAIRKAILEIKNNPERAAQMSKKAVEHAKKFDLSNRVKRIVSFIQEKSI